MGFGVEIITLFLFVLKGVSLRCIFNQIVKLLHFRGLKLLCFVVRVRIILLIDILDIIVSFCAF